MRMVAIWRRDGVICCPETWRVVPCSTLRSCTMRCRNSYQLQRIVTFCDHWHPMSCMVWCGLNKCWEAVCILLKGKPVNMPFSTSPNNCVYELIYVFEETTRKVSMINVTFSSVKYKQVYHYFASLHILSLSILWQVYRDCVKIFISFYDNDFCVKYEFLHFLFVGSR